MKFGIQEGIISKINTVFENYPEVRQVIIYGSRALGNYKEGSDIDLSIKGNNLTNDILSQITLDIDELNTPYLFDISIFDNLNSPDLKEHILREGKIFYLSSF